jgi:hypothetical protein
MGVNLTAVTATVGAVLGVWNLVQGFWQRRVRLHVVPKLSANRGVGAFLSSDRDVLPDGFACIEVTNLSAFPVTIAEVGFSLIGEEGRGVIIPNPTSLLPKRLEPRESIDIRVTKGIGFPKRARRGYAATQCKHIRYGDSIVLKKHRTAVKG